MMNIACLQIRLYWHQAASISNIFSKVRKLHRLILELIVRWGTSEYFKQYIFTCRLAIWLFPNRLIISAGCIWFCKLLTFLYPILKPYAFNSYLCRLINKIVRNCFFLVWKVTTRCLLLFVGTFYSKLFIVEHKPKTQNLNQQTIN